MRYLLAVSLVMVIAGCSHSPTEPGGVSSVALNFGRSATVGTTTFSFGDVADSRCPATEACVWEGDAAVRLDSGATSITLHSNSNAGPVSGRIGALTITLVNVAPPRSSPDSPKKSDYVITLRISS